MTPAQVSQRNFVGSFALLFVASTTLTIALCIRMSAMHEMPMPGGWRMSMMWMRMPGQTWPGAAASFLGMWLVMMAAMMLPPLLPMLQRYRSRVAIAGAAELDRLTAVTGGAYFVVWALFGAAAFLVGAALASLEMELPTLARAVPLATGAIVSIAGVVQFGTWKARRLACCRGALADRDSFLADARSAWRHGLRLGALCVHCCLGLTIALLVIGTMDPRAMAVVTAAIWAERLAPGGERIARLLGVILVAAGLYLLARALTA